jgi:hypothetical protein
MTAHDLAQIRKKVTKISTGSKQLDAILGGYDFMPTFASFCQGGQTLMDHSGFQSMSISEVCNAHL